MNVFDNPILAKGIAIAATGVVMGLLISIGRGLLRLVLKYKCEAVTVPKEELLSAFAIAIAPITKMFYAFIVAIVLSQRNLVEEQLSKMTFLVCGAFAVVAVLQGVLAARLINAPVAREDGLSDFRVKMAMQGGFESLAIVVLVGTIVLTARFSA